MTLAMRLEQLALLLVRKRGVRLGGKLTTLGSLTFTHGTAAGNRMVFTAAQSNLTQPTYSDSDGIHMLNLPYVATPTTAGNNEVSLAFT